MYDQKSESVGASLYLALDRELVPNTEYPAFEKASTLSGESFLFSETADKYAKLLIANDYLSLERWEQVRFWPGPDDDLSCPTLVDAITMRVDFIIYRHRQVMKALAENVPKCMLPITGGSDSRTLLAFAKPFLDKIDLFIHVTGWTSRNDYYSAREVAKAAGVDLHVIDALRDESILMSDDERARRTSEMRLAQGMIGETPEYHPFMVDITNALPRDAIVLRGQVINIGKGYYIGQQSVDDFIRSDGMLYKPRTVMKSLELEWETKAEAHYYRSRYMDWEAALPDVARTRVLDLALVEQHRPHSMGRLFSAFNQNFYVIPSCDRNMVHTLMSFPMHLRFHLYIFDMFLERTAPELIDVPYNRLFKEFWSGFRRSETLEQQLLNLPLII